MHTTYQLCYGVLMDQIQKDAALAQIVQLQTTALNYLNKVAVLLAEYQDATSPTLSRGARKIGSNIRSLQAWIDWLSDNGPALRQDIWDGSGYNLSKTGYEQTREWKPPMTFWDDDAVPLDTVFRMQASHTGQGRPPMLYFLWSQRYDVRDKYGVGPERPTDDGPQVVEPAPTDTVRIYDPLEREGTSGEVPGVPPKTVEPEPTVEPDSQRFATIDEWNEHWAGEFKFLAQYGSKPTDEVREQMVATLPEGVDPNGALAVAYSTAVRKSNQAMVGVVMPPEVTATDGDDLDWET